MKSPLLFVHIPKTAGVTIRVALGIWPSDSWKRVYYLGHDPYHVLKQNNKIQEEVFKFSVVRNPFTRIYSYYDHYKRFFFKQISFNDFLQKIEKGEMSNNSLVGLDQSFYIFENGKTELNKIYRFEDIKELESDLGVFLDNFNVGSYSKEEYNNDYTERNIELVKTIYARDFHNLGYSQNFA